MKMVANETIWMKAMNVLQSQFPTRVLWTFGSKFQMYNKHDTQFNLSKMLKAAQCVHCILCSSNDVGCWMLDVGIQRPTNETTINEQIIIIS